MDVSGVTADGVMGTHDMQQGLMAHARHSCRFALADFNLVRVAILFISSAAVFSTTNRSSLSQMIARFLLLWRAAVFKERELGMCLPCGKETNSIENLNLRWPAFTCCDPIEQVWISCVSTDQGTVITARLHAANPNILSMSPYRDLLSRGSMLHEHNMLQVLCCSTSIPQVHQLRERVL